VSGVAEATAAAAAVSTARLEVEHAGGTVTLTLAQGEDERFIRSSAYAPWFTLSRYDYDRISDALAALAAPEENGPADEEAAEEAGAGAAGDG
jgi:hypothetical protein